MELYCDNCKKKTVFEKTGDVFQKYPIVKCTTCKALHAIPSSESIGGSK